MRIPRIFLPNELAEKNNYELPEKTGHYLNNVLRIKVGRGLILFNNTGFFSTQLLLKRIIKKR